MAPPLTVTDWVKGGPVDLTAGRGQKIYVLDIWATWCVPCLQEIPNLTRIQRKYQDQGVVIVGLAAPGMPPREQLAQVKRFVGDRGDQIGYVIGWDQNNGIWRDYMAAAQAPGIPHTFVIDKTGRLAWQGHPQEGLEGVLDELVAGTFDLEKAAARRQNQIRLGRLLIEFQMAMQMGDLKKGLSVLDEAISVEPDNVMLHATVYRLHANDVGDLPAYRRWAEAFIENRRGNSDALVALATALLTVDPPANRMPELGLRVVQTAHDATGGKNIEVLVAYARMAQELGRLDEAVRLQTRAVELAPDPRKPELQRTLDYYQLCHRLGQTRF